MNKKTIGGETALMKAAEHGDYSLIIYLIKSECDVFIMDCKGRTADIYLKLYHPDSPILSVLIEYMEKLKEGDIDIANQVT